MRERDFVARFSAQWVSLSLLAFTLLSCGGSAVAPPSSLPPPPTTPPPAVKNIQNVIIIVMENHNWTGDGADSIKDNPLAPYFNGTLIPMASHADNYNNPPKIHPSLPNYLWLEAGTNFGILDDEPVAANHQTTTQHLVTLLTTAGISWRSYDEATSGKSCLLAGPWHTPFEFFDDVTDNQNPTSANCTAHVRPLKELAGDLANGTNARYSFIIPQICNSMHSVCNGIPEITAGDNWLKANVPLILASDAYKNGVLFILFDEAEHGDGPIPMLVLSPFAKGGGYSNSTYYNHGSTLRTVEEIFGLKPMLGDAANQPDLSDLFKSFP